MALQTGLIEIVIHPYPKNFIVYNYTQFLFVNLKVYLILKRDKLLIYTVTWIYLKATMLNERNQFQKVATV